MMSNQEMQFADPEWTPSTKLEVIQSAPPRSINHAIEDEQETIVPSYENDKLPSEQEHKPGRRVGKRIGRRAFSVGLLIAGAGALGGLLWWVERRATPVLLKPQSPEKLTGSVQQAQGHTPQVTDTGPIRTVKLVNDPPKVIVKCSGDVNITGYLSREVDARAFNSRPYTGLSIISDNIRFSFNKQGNELTVTVDPPPDDNGKIILNLTIFQYALLEVQAGGNINAQNIMDTVVSLTSTSGGITLSGTLTGTSTLHSAQGIQFLGALSENGTYDMQSDQGNVELILPDGTMFQLQAKTNGTVSNDFPTANPEPFQQAELSITAYHGDIVIKKSF